MDRPPTPRLTSDTTLNTSLQFTGDIAPFFGLLLALGLAALAFWLYRRETKDRFDRLRWLLPTLRAAAIFLAVLALTGPILHHEKVIRELGKLFVFVDGSKSMQMTDEEMAPERKIASMQAMGMLPRPEATREAADALALLSRAQFTAERGIRAGAESPDLKEIGANVHADVEDAFEGLKVLEGKLGSLGSAPGLILSQRFPSSSRFFDKGFRNRPKDHPEPTQTRFVEQFRFPETTDSDFMVWMRGYLVPPADGRYRFWISSDDRGELWLGQNDDPKTAQRIARVDSHTAEFAYDGNGEQRSREIQLKAGQHYFIEAILSAEYGENHLAVAWQAPDTDKRVSPIAGEFLIPFDTGSAKNEALSITAYKDSLLAKTSTLKEALAAGSGDPFAHIDTLREINGSVIALKSRLRESVLSAASAYYAANRESETFQEKLAEFDSLDRKARVERLLLDPDTGVMPLLAEGQDIELLSLRDSESDSLWWQRRGGRKTAGPMPIEVKLTGAGSETDLAEAVLETIGDAERDVGILIFSDGKHNTSNSPVASATTLGEQGIPIFTVGTGALAPPEDMAVVDVDAPETVFSRDRVNGTITLRDTVRSGEFRLKITSGEQVVWERTFDADGRGEREFDYDFPIEEIAQAYRAANAQQGIKIGSVPLSFDVSVESTTPFVVDPFNEDGTPAPAPVLTPTQRQLAANDSKPMFVQAIDQARRILLIDARPRWETRYLHNMFQRDEQWQVNALMQVFTEADQGKSWDRGTTDGTFPNSREELFKYESVFIGDVPRHLFTDNELLWLQEFVENRGGGITFLDGQRGHLRGYEGTPLAKVLPVRYTTGIEEDLPKSEDDMPTAMTLTAEGADFAPLRFASAGGENEEIWQRLRPPHWSAGVEAMPGATVLAHAEFSNDRRVPTVVWRRLGAGKVLYSGTDELWRWRYNVADRYHQKFWIQMANWVGEKPFSVAGQSASIGTDKLVYSPGSTASIRVRIRDDEGKPVSEGDYIAVLYDADESIAAEIELEADENGGGMFRGRTSQLSSGEYEVAIRQKYFLRKATEFDARAPLMVKTAADRELDDLALDRDLLQNIARASGGQYFAEEESRNLVDLLESIDRKKVIPSQTVLWSSYWWFAAIIALLTAEWILRKRAGYV